MLNFIMFFYMITSLYGNNFLKLFHSSPLYILIIISSLYLIFSPKKKLVFNSSKMLTVIYIYIYIVIIYIIYSFSGLVNIFNISDFYLDRSFILRQVYFIFCLPIGMAIFKQVIIKEEPFIFLYKYGSIFIVVLSLIYIITGYGDTRILSVALSSIALLIYYKKSNKMGILLVLTSLIVIVNGATEVLIKVTLLTYVIGRINLSKIIAKYHKVMLFVFITIIALYFNQIISLLKNLDPNSWWRIVYWRHELQILYQTYFIGVGFGTPYHTELLYNILGGGWIIPEEYSNFNDVLYLTAQHSSFVNAFYRLGLIGGSVFLYFNIIVIKYSYLVSSKIDKSKRKVLKWAEFSFIASTINIALNVGLESPRIFISYLIFTSILIALIVRYQNEASIAKNTKLETIPTIK